MHPLVDAFYKGRAVLKKTTGQYFDSRDKPNKACHVGAVYYGLYGKPESRTVAVFNKINSDYPEFTKKIVAIPCEHRTQADPDSEIGAILIHLNDDHNGHTWPDKKVADWLEGALK